MLLLLVVAETSVLRILFLSGMDDSSRSARGDADVAVAVEAAEESDELAVVGVVVAMLVAVLGVGSIEDKCRRLLLLPATPIPLGPLMSSDGKTDPLPDVDPPYSEEDDGEP